MINNISKRRISESKELFIVAFLLVNSLSWWFFERQNIYVIYEEAIASLSQKVIVFGVQDLLIICSGIIGAFLSDRMKKLSILSLWMILGVFSSILMCLLPYLSLAHSILITFFCAISFGIGMPSCLGYFADLTTFENRASTAGLVFFIASAITPLTIMISISSTMLSLLAALIWRGIGLSMLGLLKKTSKDVTEKEKSRAFTLILTDKKFLLYLFPWFMFSLIYGFQKVILEKAISADLYALLRVIQSIFGTSSAIISGPLCDKVGRKPVVIYGFVSLGIAYAAVSMAPNSLLALYFYSVIDGVSWGIFMVIFVLVLWGDLSSITLNSKEKYYAIGGIPFFLAEFTGFILKPHLQISVNAAFSIASFFLFLAVIPLMYAPETLPEKVIRRRELREYVEKAKKIREKYERKND